MSRSREENASDLAHENMIRVSAETYLREGPHFGWPRSLFDKTGPDEEAWREGIIRASNDVCLKVRVCEDIMTLLDGREIHIPTLFDVIQKSVQQEADRELQYITRVCGDPVLETGNGSWHLIDTAEKAKLATRVTGTAIYQFWTATREYTGATGGDSHDWLMLVDDTGKGRVAMAALRDGVESAYDGTLADCHITGFQNESAWDEYLEDIQAIAAHRELIVYPSHMGQPIPAVDEDTPEP